MDPAILGLLAAAGIVVATDDAPDVARPGTTGGTPYKASQTLAKLRGTYSSGTVMTATTNPLVRAPAATTQNAMSAETEIAVRLKMEAQFAALTGEAKRLACERVRARFPESSNVRALNCATATFGQLLAAVAAAVGFSATASGSALGILSVSLFQVDIGVYINAALGGAIKTPSGEPVTVPTSKEEAVQQGANEAATQSGQALTAFNSSSQPLSSWVASQTGGR